MNSRSFIDFAEFADRPDWQYSSQARGEIVAQNQRDQRGAGWLIRLNLIGQMSAQSEYGALELPRVRKTRALLAILVLADGKPVLREKIAALLWSSREREQGRASLRQCVHEVQEFCAANGLARLRTGRQHLVFDLHRVWTDVVAITEATAGQGELLDLIKGELLEDLAGLDSAFDAWIAVEARRLRAAVVNLAGLVLDRQSEPKAVIASARRLVALAPANETGWQRLIQAHLDCGEQAAAMEALDRCTRELGITSNRLPAAETRALLDAGTRPVMSSATAAATPKRRHKTGVWLGVSVFRTADPSDAETIGVELAEEIATAMARLRWLNLIAPSTTAGGGQDIPDPAERWRSLDIDFLIDGVIQRRQNPAGGDTLRVTVRLLDMRAGGEMLWSQRFERQAADMLALQDDIAAATAAQADPHILLQESRRAAQRPPDQASALDLMLRAVPAIFRLVEPDYSAAGQWLERAAEMAPDNAAILGWYACWHLFLVGQSFAPHPADAMRRARDLAQRAVALDPGCARALSIAAHVNSFLLHKDIEETIALHERALALNPNLPFAWAVSCLSLAYAGRHEQAVLHGERARSLSPFDPHSFFFDSALIVPCLARREFDRAVTLGRRSLALNPSMMGTMKGLLSALGHLGRWEEAAELRSKMLRQVPGFSLAAAMERSALRQPEDRAIFAEGLRMAGLV